MALTSDRFRAGWLLVAACWLLSATNSAYGQTTTFEAYLRKTVWDIKNHEQYVEQFVPLEWREPARATGSQ